MKPEFFGEVTDNGNRLAEIILLPFSFYLNSLRVQLGRFCKSSKEFFYDKHSAKFPSVREKLFIQK